MALMYETFGRRRLTPELWVVIVNTVSNPEKSQLHKININMIILMYFGRLILNLKFNQHGTQTTYSQTSIPNGLMVLILGTLVR